MAAPKVQLYPDITVMQHLKRDQWNNLALGVADTGTMDSSIPANILPIHSNSLLPYWRVQEMEAFTTPYTVVSAHVHTQEMGTPQCLHHH